MRHVLIVLLLMASTARAESWRQVANLDKKGGALLLDIASIASAGEVHTASFKSVYKSDRPISGGYQDVPADARSYRWESNVGHFNCTARTVAVSQSILHGTDDQVLGKREVDSSALEFHEVAPGSLGGLLLQAVCASAQEPGVGLATITHLANPDDFYPAGARRRGEEGAPVVKVCVGPSGEFLREPELAETSGYPELDTAGVKAAKAMRYKSAIQDGVAMQESCIKYKVKFTRFPH